MSRKLNTHVLYNYTLAPSVDEPAEFEGTIKCIYQEQVHRLTNNRGGDSTRPPRPPLSRYPWPVSSTLTTSPATWSTRSSRSRSRSCMACFPGPRHQSLLAQLGAEQQISSLRVIKCTRGSYFPRSERTSEAGSCDTGFAISCTEDGGYYCGGESYEGAREESSA